MRLRLPGLAVLAIAAESAGHMRGIYDTRGSVWKSVCGREQETGRADSLGQSSRPLLIRYRSGLIPRYQTQHRHPAASAARMVELRDVMMSSTEADEIDRTCRRSRGEHSPSHCRLRCGRMQCR